MVAHNGKLYAFGGASEGVHDPILHVYDLHSHLWTDHRATETGSSYSFLVREGREGREIEGQLPTGRLFHSAVTIGDGMYIFGGMTEQDGSRRRTSEIYRFQFSSYPRCTLHDDFGRMLESRQLCDLRFLVGKDRVPIYAHIAIVAARSAFLRNLIKQSREASGAGAVVASPPSPGLPQQQSEQLSVLDVAVPDAEPFAFEMILAYIYTDNIDPTQRGHLLTPRHYLHSSLASRTRTALQRSRPAHYGSLPFGTRFLAQTARVSRIQVRENMDKVYCSSELWLRFQVPRIYDRRAECSGGSEQRQPPRSHFCQGVLLPSHREGGQLPPHRHVQG